MTGWAGSRRSTVKVTMISVSETIRKPDIWPATAGVEWNSAAQTSQASPIVTPTATSATSSGRGTRGGG